MLRSLGSRHTPRVLVPILVPILVCISKYRRMAVCCMENLNRENLKVGRVMEKLGNVDQIKTCPFQKEKEVKEFFI